MSPWRVRQVGASRFGEYDKLQPQTTSEQFSIGNVRALSPARVPRESLKSKDYEVANRASRRPKGNVWIGIPRGEERNVTTVLVINLVFIIRHGLPPFLIFW